MLKYADVFLRINVAVVHDDGADTPTQSRKLKRSSKKKKKRLKQQNEAAEILVLSVL